MEFGTREVVSGYVRSSDTYFAVKQDTGSRALNSMITRPLNPAYTSRCVNADSRLHTWYITRRTCQLRHESIICMHAIVWVVSPSDRSRRTGRCGVNTRSSAGVPAGPDRGLTGRPALQHMPLKVTHLAGSSPAEHTAAAAGDRSFRLSCPRVHVVESPDLGARRPRPRRRLISSGRFTSSGAGGLGFGTALGGFGGRCHLFLLVFLVFLLIVVLHQKPKSSEQKLPALLADKKQLRLPAAQRSAACPDLVVLSWNSSFVSVFLRDSIKVFEGNLARTSTLLIFRGGAGFESGGGSFCFGGGSAASSIF